MKRCEDCIHMNICGYYAEFKEIDNDCRWYKGKADFVEEDKTLSKRLDSLDINEISELVKSYGAELNLIFYPECLGVKLTKYDWSMITHLNYNLMKKYNNDINHIVCYKINEFIEELNRKINEEEITK